jgi:hypothetical protein
LFRAFDKDDAIEIHDEDRIFLAEFENLVELNADYTASGLSLWEFLETHWSHKVMDYLSQNGESIRVDSLCNLLGRPDSLVVVPESLEEEGNRSSAPPYHGFRGFLGMSLPVCTFAFVSSSVYERLSAVFLCLPAFPEILSGTHI